MPTNVHTPPQPSNPANLASAPHSRKHSFQQQQQNGSAQPGSAGASVPSKQSSGDSEYAVGLRQDYVFCDPVAFRYLEEETHCSAVFRNRILTGYEVYIVEQWACSREHPTFVISTYTGDAAHEVTVSVLRISADESQWSARLHKYFELSRRYARPKQTALGTLMVTNLSSFPSALTVVPVPDGDVRKHRVDFIVNEDLKRMGCSGRSALSLAAPPDASQTKFHQLFRTSERVPFQTAVQELVRLCQLALVVFDKLPLRYADGLLCDVTEKGLREWWDEFGAEMYQSEPNDGILGPTTVAGLLGMLIGARNRLSVCGAPVPKDAFDLPAMEKAIQHFQRQQHYRKQYRTGKLDHETFEVLRRITDKSSASADIFAVPRAIKSTVADLSARAVGSSSSGPVEPRSVETVDIDRFIECISGESTKFLWLGKARKTTAPTTSTSTAAVATTTGGGSAHQSPTPVRRNSTGGQSLSDPEIMVSRGVSRESSESPAAVVVGGAGQVYHLAGSTPSVHAQDHATPVSDLRKAVFRTMTGRMKEVASGISAGADYVRNRGQQRSSTKDLSLSLDDECVGGNFAGGNSISPPYHAHAPPYAAQAQAHAPNLAPIHTTITVPTSLYGKHASTGSPGARDYAFVESPMAMDSSHHHYHHHQHFPSPYPPPPDFPYATPHNNPPGIKSEPISPSPTPIPNIHIDSDSSPASSTHVPAPALAPRPNPRSRSHSRAPSQRRALPQRRHSIAAPDAPRHPEYYPRRLSFSIASSAVLSWTLPFSPPSPFSSSPRSLSATSHSASLSAAKLESWLHPHLHALAALDARLTRDVAALTDVADERDETVHSSMRAVRAELVPRETAALREQFKDVETLGARMEYELQGLQGRVRELEEAVAGLGRFVEDLEERAGGIEEAGKGGGGWWAWVWGRRGAGAGGRRGSAGAGGGGGMDGGSAGGKEKVQ